MDLFILVPICALIGLLFAAYSYRVMKREDEGSDLMKKIAAAIRIGAMVYLKRQYTAILVFMIAMAVVLTLAINPLTTVCFIVGASLSALAGYIGMKAATYANVRTTNAAKMGMANAFRVSYASGTVMGLIVVGLGLLGLSALFYVFSTMTVLTLAETVNVLFGFSLGESSIALFASDRIFAVDIQYDQLSGRWWRYWDQPYGLNASASYLAHGTGPLTDTKGKNRIIAHIRAENPGRTLLVGDGLSDLEAGDEVDLFIGFGGVKQREIVALQAPVYIKSLLSYLPSYL